MNTEKGFASILIILLAVVVVGGGVYVFVKKDISETTFTNETQNLNSEEDTLLDIENVSDPVPQITANKQPTISWKTYQNKDLAFSLQIPENTKVRETIGEYNRLVSFEYDDGFFVVREEKIGKYGQSLDDWNFRQIKALPFTETLVAGNRALRYVIPSHGSGGERFDDEVMVITEYNGNIYHFEFHTVKVLTEVQNKILSSVQLTQKTSDTPPISNF